MRNWFGVRSWEKNKPHGWLVGVRGLNTEYPQDCMRVLGKHAKHCRLPGSSPAVRRSLKGACVDVKQRSGKQGERP
jgi:hypothetical protein